MTLERMKQAPTNFISFSQIVIFPRIMKKQKRDITKSPNFVGNWYMIWISIEIYRKAANEYSNS